MTESTFSVTQLNRYIKDLFEKDNLLFNVFVKGEISNWKLHYSGHAYFSLKDEKSTLRAIMFKADSHLNFVPKNGQKVIVIGRVSVFERDGQYQLYADDIIAQGVGDLHYQYEQLVKKLKEEGLFDESKKKPIPKFPQKIGIVTSDTGAAIRDILNILSRRWKSATVYLYPALVQGKDAPPQIVKALTYLDKKVDVIIAGRGGGSMEDLWAFNDEDVARTIAGLHTPIISAVGHETDFTISDFVADLRAPTPSAAAELAVPNTLDLQQYLKEMELRLLHAYNSFIDKKRLQVQNLFQRPVNPYEIVDKNRQYVDRLLKDLKNAMQRTLSKKQDLLSSTSAILDSLSPLAVLGRGYALAEKADGTTIKSIQHMKEDDDIRLRFYDGRATCKVQTLET